MHALLQNGPLANQQIEVPDSAPQVIHRVTGAGTHIYYLVGIQGAAAMPPSAGQQPATEHDASAEQDASAEPLAIYSAADELLDAA